MVCIQNASESRAAESQDRRMVMQIRSCECVITLHSTHTLGTASTSAAAAPSIREFLGADKPPNHSIDILDVAQQR